MSVWKILRIGPKRGAHSKFSPATERKLWYIAWRGFLLQFEECVACVNLGYCYAPKPCIIHVHAHRTIIFNIFTQFL